MHSPFIAEPPPGSDSTSLPLVVDLDGTLICTDMLHESALQLFRSAPLDALRIPAWLHQGKAALKQELAQRAPLDVTTLPYREDFLQWLHQQRALGRRLIRLQCYEGLDAASAVYEWNFPAQMVAIRTAEAAAPLTRGPRG